MHLSFKFQFDCNDCPQHVPGSTTISYQQIVAMTSLMSEIGTICNVKSSASNLNIFFLSSSIWYESASHTGETAYSVAISKYSLQELWQKRTRRYRNLMAKVLTDSCTCLPPPPGRVAPALPSAFSSCHHWYLPHCYFGGA